MVLSWVQMARWRKGQKRHKQNGKHPSLFLNRGDVALHFYCDMLNSSSVIQVHLLIVEMYSYFIACVYHTPLPHSFLHRGMDVESFLRYFNVLVYRWKSQHRQWPLHNLLHKLFKQPSLSWLCLFWYGGYMLRES